MAKTLVPDLAIEAAHSAIPTQMTDPKFSHKVSVHNDVDQPFDLHAVLQTRMHMVLFYKKLSNEDSGWHVGGWMKETLGRALVENPILAGRFRRSGDGGLEIVSNDNGVRCVEAQTSLSLEEFLQSKDKSEAEAELVFWNNVDEVNPQFSPLFYVQVTNFQGGGYSVGLSYNLLLIDPLLLDKFLNKWLDIHRNMAFDDEIPKIPLFYAPNFKQTIPQSTNGFTSNPSGKTSKTTMFSISTNEKLKAGDEICKYLVLLCIEEAERELDYQMGSNFMLITKESNGDVQVEKSSKEGIVGSLKNLKYELNTLKWEDLKTKEIAFRRENVPVDVSHWVACDALEGVVLVVVSSTNEDESCMNVYVTCPNKVT
uniref:Shikimate O-hydroxycinnamoyltransferase n=1 Tax=Opuntia streptacantha TaxID=393608 RepID=A0A7C9EVV9_OPUST